MTNILNFDPSEHNEAIKAAEAAGEDVSQMIEESYNSLLFLGKSLNTDDKDLEDVAIFNIRLCYMYFHHVEDYGKLGKLIELVKLLEYGGTSVVDNQVKDKVTVNLN